MDCSEFKGFLHDYLSTSDGKIAGLVAHESIHCQQHNWQKQTLLSVALHEGASDFLPALVLHTNINGLTYKYGFMHECDLWNEFQKDVDKTDLSRWLFNTRESKDRPGDLGYFMGSRICESYYNSRPDKNKAISDLLDGSKHQDVLLQSGYNGNCK